MTKAPTMQRSRSQLATAYSPHQPFTFEGGEGACIALPWAGNPEAPISDVTKRTIADQIQEYFEAWASQARRGQDLKHEVPLELTVDRVAISGDAVLVRIGDLAFHSPRNVGYVPFPLSFKCNRCGLHRQCRSVHSAPAEIANFPTACPTGAATCANDWRQLDVVFAHWSGELEALTPSFRYWDGNAHKIRDKFNCEACGGERFYLRSPVGPFAGWHFECVVPSCRLSRQILQRDKATLEVLGPLIPSGNALPFEINMEPISYRASALHYPHGDRLLVFDDDRLLSQLADDKLPELSRTLSNLFGYPVSALSDADRERILRAAGPDRAREWEDYVQIRDLIDMLSRQNGAEQMLNTQRRNMTRLEQGWISLFAPHQTATQGIIAACVGRNRYVRRFDPIRMAIEHESLRIERLHSGQMNDGKAVSVDVRILDNFLKPDALSASEAASMLNAVTARLEMLGIEEMRFVRDVKVCDYTFGFTRTESRPVVRRDKAGSAEMPVRLRLFAKVGYGEREAAHPVLCIQQSNEGFYVRLDEGTVMEWLEANGINLPVSAPGVRLGGQLLEQFPLVNEEETSRFSRFLSEYRRDQGVTRSAYPFVYTLLHTAAHHLITVASSMSGLDLGSFGEHLFVSNLAFLVYRRGTTMDLGNLSSMWRERADSVVGNEVLDRMMNPASLRCGSESVCNHRGGACPDCILIPETSCLTRNELLSRSMLVGRGRPLWDASTTDVVGFYDVARQRRSRRPAAAAPPESAATPVA